MELKLTTNPITAATPKRIHAVNARRFFTSYFFRFSFDDERQPIITPSNFPDKTAIPAKFMTTADMIRIQVIHFFVIVLFHKKLAAFFLRHIDSGLTEQLEGYEPPDKDDQ